MAESGDEELEDERGSAVNPSATETLMTSSGTRWGMALDVGNFCCTAH